jgi:hypothetical protein
VFRVTRPIRVRQVEHGDAVRLGVVTEQRNERACELRIRSGQFEIGPVRETQRDLFGCEQRSRWLMRVADHPRLREPRTLEAPDSGIGIAVEGISTGRGARHDGRHGKQGTGQPARNEPTHCTGLPFMSTRFDSLSASAASRRAR